MPSLGLLPAGDAARILDSGGLQQRALRSRKQAAHVRPDAPAQPDVFPKGKPPQGTFNTDTRVDFDAESLITTVTAAATVARPFSEVARLMDPRAWAHYTELWLESYAVLQNAQGRPRFDSEGTPERDEDPKHLSSHWGKSWQGLLFERTDWELNERLVSKFDVLLNIDFRVGTGLAVPLQLELEEQPIAGGQRLLHDYSLYEALSGRLGYQELDGGIEVDSGYARAVECSWRGTTVTRVEVQKSLRYSDFTPGSGDEGPFDPGQLFNYLSPGIAGVWIGSLVGEGLNAPI